MSIPWFFVAQVDWDLVRPAGAAFLLVLGLWGISTYGFRLLNRPYKHLAFWAAGVAFIFGASTLIIREKLNLPAWNGEINSIAYGTKIAERGDDVVVLAAVTIWNAGKLPSRVTNWRLLATFDHTADAMQAELRLSPAPVVLMDPDGSSKTYTAEDNLLVKALGPIPAESKLSEILVGVFGAANKELFTQHVEYTVIFEDMLTQKHELATRPAK